MNKCSQESTKSQQEVLKPASSDVNKSSQDSDKSHRDESLQPDQSVSHGKSPSRKHHQSSSHHQTTAIEWMTIGLHTTPRGATPILDTDQVILDEDPIQGVLPTHVHPGDVLTGPDLCPDPIGGAGHILTAEPDPDPDLMEGVAIVLRITTV